MVSPEKFWAMSSSVHFLGYKMYALFGGDVMWHAMVMDEVFRKSTNSADRSIVGRDEVIPGISIFIYSHKDKTQIGGPNQIKLQPGENGAHSALATAR